MREQLRAWPVPRVVLLVLGAVLTANAAWLAFTANLTIGTAMAAILGLGLLAWALWYAKVGRAMTITALGVLTIFVGLAVFLVVYGSTPTATYREDAVIVLGAAVHGDELSKTLTARLDTALDYHARNPAAVIVVTGGKGPQENVAEGDAMAAYLGEHGVPASQILVEARATSTEENFAFSQTLLNARFPGGYHAVVISDEFHLYRATQIAAKAGLAVTRLGRATPWYFWAANFLREDLMVIKFWLTGS